MVKETTPFSILGLPARFALADEVIEEAWRKTIALVHPDRFAGRPAQERRVAEQWAGRINQAKDTVIDPVGRAQALLKLRGIDVASETDTRMPADFLMQQMSWREALAEANDAAQIDGLQAEVQAERAQLLEVLAQSLDGTPEGGAADARARSAVRRLMFVQKMMREIDARRTLLATAGCRTPNP